MSLLVFDHTQGSAVPHPVEQSHQEFLQLQTKTDLRHLLFSAPSTQQYIPALIQLQQGTILPETEEG